MTSIDLVPDWQVGDLRLTEYPYSVDADSTVDIGEPEVIVTTVSGMLADGDIEQEERSGNRTYSLSVYIEGADLAAVVEAEANLRRELRRSGLTLTHDPGDGFAPASVYDVLVARMKVERQDPHESHLIRRVALTLTCAPFARSAELTTMAALEVPSTETLVNVDTCDSATGWSASYNGLPADVSTTWQPGAVSVLDVLQPGGQTLTLTRTGFINFSTTPYLRVDIGYRADLGALPITVTVGGALSGGATLQPLEQRMTSPGRFIFTYDTGGVTVDSLTFTSVTSTDTADLKIYNVARSDMPPSITSRQHSRIIQPGGTERTPASIHVFSDYDIADMQVGIIHTHPVDGLGYAPPLRRWRVSGNTETAAEGDTLSLETEALKPNSIICEVPNTGLPPDGYILALRVKSSVTNTVGIDWAVQTFFPSTTTTMEGVAQGTTPWTPKAAGQYEIVPLAALTLPTVRGADGTTRVSFRCLASDADLFWDEAFLFRAGDDCALTIVDHPASHLWLDSPDLGSPTPSVWEGWASDRSDIRHPGSRLQAMGSHVLHPEGTVVHAAAITNQLRVSAEFYRRWHSNAAE